MAKLSDLSEIDRKHWQLHLNAAVRDHPSDARINKEAEEFLKDKDLPNIKHPAHIHNWLEFPDERSEMEIEIEVSDG